MPKATPRDIAQSIRDHQYTIPAKFDKLIDGNKSEPESEAHAEERTRYWASLRKKVMQPGVKIPDGRLIGFTFGRGMTK